MQQAAESIAAVAEMQYQIDRALLGRTKEIAFVPLAVRIVLGLAVDNRIGQMVPVFAVADKSAPAVPAVPAAERDFESAPARRVSRIKPAEERWVLLQLGWEHFRRD